MNLSAQELMRVLPHRYPFLLVDKITELIPNRRAIGLKNVSINEPYFVGHFPGHPVMPGVLIIEMLAQIGGVMMLSHDAHSGQIPYLAGIDKVRFRKPVHPGDTLLGEVEIIKARGSMGWVRAVARVGDDVVCEAEMSFAMVAPEAETATDASGAE